MTNVSIVISSYCKPWGWNTPSTMVVRHNFNVYSHVAQTKIKIQLLNCQEPNNLTTTITISPHTSWQNRTRKQNFLWHCFHTWPLTFSTSWSSSLSDMSSSPKYDDHLLRITCAAYSCHLKSDIGDMVRVKLSTLSMQTNT